MTSDDGTSVQADDRRRKYAHDHIEKVAAPGEGIMKIKKYISAPRIEVVLVPDKEDDNVNVSTTLFDVWLVMHVPDGQPPTTVRLDDGPYSRRDAQLKLMEVWNHVGMAF